MPAEMAYATEEDLEAVWLTSFRRYAADLLKIQPMPDPSQREIGGTQLKNLVLNEPQRLLDDIIETIRSEGRPVRLVILKARREGVSTYIAGRDYWMTTTRFNRYAMIITHEPEATEFLFQMHKRFYQHNPVWKPKIVYNNKKLLHFDTPQGTGLGSAIRVATAGKEDIGSGQAIHYLHLSEMAKWPAHTTEAIMTSVMQCVPKSLDTEVVIESTAKGVGGEFYDRYWGARHRFSIVLKDGVPTVERELNEKSDINNEFASVFMPWFVFSAYQMDPGADFKRTEREDTLAKTYGLTDRHLAWRRWCIANQCNGLEEIFQQEYPSNATEAFISSGSPVFDLQQLIRLRATAPDPKMRYTIRISDGQFVADPVNGDFLVWEEPIMGEDYVISGDVAEGIDRNVMGRVADYSSLGVWRSSTGEQVAEWHGKMDSDQFGVLMCHVGGRYNTGWLVPERNNHGNSTVLKIMECRYPRVYVERVPEPPNKIRKRYGWLTTRANKVDIVDNLLAEMRDGTHGIKSRAIFEEMMSFKKEGDKYGAEAGKFDDRVMMAMIGKFVIPRLRPSRYNNKTQTFGNSVSVAPPVGAWMV